MADDPIKSYLENNGLASPLPSKFTGPETLDDYLDQQGLVERSYEDEMLPQVSEIEEAEEEEKDGFLYKVGQMRGPQFAGNLIKGAITPFSSIPKQIGIFAANLGHSTGLGSDDPREMAFYKLGEGMDWIGEAVTCLLYTSDAADE